MKAIVLAGGQEFGQCPLARQAPRALWPLVDQPIIRSVLAALRTMGIGEMAISANGRTHDIAHCLGDHPSSDISIHYSEDPLPRGAAGCIKDCEPWLGLERFVVVHGASLLIDVDFRALLAEHAASDAAVTLAATLDGDARGSVYGLRPTGIYVCEPEILAYIKEVGYQDMKEQLIPRLLHAGLKVRAVPVGGRVIPIRNEESYLNAMVEVLESAATHPLLTGHLPASRPGLWIDPTADISPTARIVGPVYIGPGARIASDAVIIGPALIGPDCQLGSEAVVHESILWREARIGVAATLEQSVIAAAACVESGSLVRGSIVVQSSLSAAERQSLDPSDLPNNRPWWQRMLTMPRPSERQAV